MKRLSAHDRGYDSKWRKLREMKLKSDPLCEWHLEKKEYVKATLVHHIKEVESYPELRLVMENLWSSCYICHEHHHKQDSNRGCDKTGAPVDPNHHWNK